MSFQNPSTQDTTRSRPTVIAYQLGDRLIQFQDEMDKFEQNPFVQEILELADTKSNPRLVRPQRMLSPISHRVRRPNIHNSASLPQDISKCTCSFLDCTCRRQCSRPFGTPVSQTRDFRSDNYEVYDTAEMCRTYAGIEATFGDNMDLMLPSLYSLVMAGFSCPRYLRRWLWCKLAHLEPLGRNYIEPIKEACRSCGAGQSSRKGIGFGKERPEP